MAQKIDGRVVFADLLRVFATIAVVALHVAGSHMADVAVGSAAWNVFNLYDGLVRWCVPVFLMLSGMFMLDAKEGRSLGKLFFHNILRVLVCLVFWGGVYALADHWLAGGAPTWRGLWGAVLNALRGDTHYHLWFLYAILGLYLVTPILRAFVRGASRGDFHYFFLLCFLFACLLPALFQVWPNATATLQTWYYRLNVQLVMGYVGYYVAGYYLRAFTISRLAEAIVYVLGVAGAVVTVWGTRALSLQAGGLADGLYSYTSPNVAAFSVAVVVLFRYVLGVSDERSRRQRVSGAARYTFGVYLVHDLFLTLLGGLGLTTLSFDPVFSVPVLTAVVFLCAFAAAWLLRHIPFVGRWIT